jgi:hypothetical protein
VNNIAHCIRVSHAAGGSGVLIVVGSGDDGPAEEIEERARREAEELHVETCHINTYYIIISYSFMFTT